MRLRSTPQRCQHAAIYGCEFFFLNVFQLVQVSAWDLCVKMAAKGLLAKPTHVRICPHNSIVLEAIKHDACAELRDPLCPPPGDDRQPDARMCVGVLRPSLLRPF